MKNFNLEKKYRNKYFYSKQELTLTKDDYYRAIILTYIFNNFPEFSKILELIDEKIKDYKYDNRYKFVFLDSYNYFDKFLYIEVSSESKFLEFFRKLDVIYNDNYYSKEKELIVCSFFDICSEDRLDVLLNQISKNKYYIKYFKKHLNTELFLSYCVDNPELRKLCPNHLKKILADILDILNKEI